VALLQFWEVRGYFSEGSSFLERALAVSEGVEGVATSVRAETLHIAGFLALVKGDAKRAEALLQRSQLLFRESGDRSGMAKILRMQGNLARTRGTFKLARRLLMEALAICKELGDSDGMADVREDLVRVFVVQGDYTKANTLLAENFTYLNASKERYYTAYPLYNQANILFLSRGDPGQARALAEQSLTLFREVRNRRFIAYISLLLGQLDLQEGKESEARAQVEEGLATMEAVEDVYGICNALLALARVLMVQGDATGAQMRYEEVWERLKGAEAGEQAAACLEGLGEIQVAQGSPEWAIHLWGAAATIRATIAAPMPPVYRVSYLQALKAAREQANEEAFSSAWNAGRQWLLAQGTALPQSIREYSPVG
jgi:ATP/maltotriose-dependent transcriptional regulator MalT